MVKQNRIGQIAVDMQDWCRGLPKYTRETAVTIEGITEEEWESFVRVRKLLLQTSINPGDLLLKKIPDAFASGIFQRVKKLYFLFLTRCETNKKECRFRQLDPKLYRGTTRGRVGGKQKKFN